jgi:phage gp36-like protein
MPWSSLTDFETHGFPRDMWTGKEVLVIGGLTAACQTCLGYFRTAPDIVTPVAEADVTEDMRKNECWIAAYGLVSVLGFDPGSDPDKVIYERYKLAMQWLRDVAAGKTNPIAVDTAPDIEFGNVQIETDELRGW